ncbi:MAG: hypothetical protein U0804_18765 [Gemmataceae bacterium]
MSSLKVFIVHLRRPRSSDPNERRDDPFYEFGSFGCTGCHRSNLLHPRHAEELNGALIAFAQGGKSGFRLVFLTPPVTVRQWDDRCELLWSPVAMPFKYSEAPILVANDDRSDFPKLLSNLLHVDRESPEGRFSSRFRSRAQPLDDGQAAEIIRVYEQFRSTAASDAFASSYEEALPYAPPCVDPQRRTTYDMHIMELDGTCGAVVSPALPPASSKQTKKCAARQCRTRPRRKAISECH